MDRNSAAPDKCPLLDFMYTGVVTTHILAVLLELNSKEGEVEVVCLGAAGDIDWVLRTDFTHSFLEPNGALGV
jgi:hypothetical protein